MLFDYDWPGFRVKRIRMAFSGMMDEVGRLKPGKLLHLLKLAKDIRKAALDGVDPILLYPPASPAWIPVLRDLLLLAFVRKHFSRVVFLQHAGGLGEWADESFFRRMVCKCTYDDADLFMEVAKETNPPHAVFHSRTWAWTPYGVEVPPAPERPLRNPGSPCRVMFLGSLQEGKGVLEILKTAALLVKQGLSDRFHFTLVGPWFSDQFREDTLRIVEELGVGSLVDFAGQMVGEEKWNTFQQSDVFFFPTHYSSEAFPLVLIEALGNGLPVVTTRWRGIPDMLEGCTTARLCDIHSPEQYRDALILFERETGEGKSFSKASREFHRERYLPQHFLNQIRALVMNKSGAGEILDSSFANMRRMVPLAVNLPITGGVSTCSGIRKSKPAFSHTPNTVVRLSVYLADQNPGHDRSLGISRMSKVVLREMVKCDDISLQVITSLSSQQGPGKGAQNTILPWSTRTRMMRLLTDQLHPVLAWFTASPDIWYFPKGFLPRFNLLKAPTVVTVHDTIIQHHADHYPLWRKKPEYAYWARMLRHTLRHADVVLTVSEHSRDMILAFMARHKMPEREITVTYEPCVYEAFEQPVDPPKSEYVLHLASREPHKRSHDLIRWWAERARVDGSLPVLELVGNIPPESWDIVASNSCFRRRPFLDDEELRNTITHARALILPSEIEGFGLPAIEAYYLGTPVCFTKGTSIEEILGQSTSTGGFELDAPESLWPALEEVLAMPAGEIHRIGLELRVRFKAEKIVGRMVDAFRKVAGV